MSEHASSIDGLGVFSNSSDRATAEMRKALRSDNPVRAARLARPGLAAGGTTSTQLVLEITEGLRRHGELIEGVELLVTALATYPEDAKLEAALQELLEDAEPDEKGSVVHLIAAERYAGQANWSKANQHYRRSLEASPTSMDALVGLVHVLLTEGKPQEAESVMRRWSPGPPESPQDFALRAAVTHESYGAVAAITIVELGLEQFPDDGMLLTLLFQLLLRADRNNEAEEVLRRTLKLNPDDLWLRLMLTQQLLAREQTDEAGPIINSLVRDAPENATVRAHQASFLLQSHQPVEAAEVLADALAVHPNDPELDVLVGQVADASLDQGRQRFMTTDTMDIRRALEAVLRLRETDVEANALLGELERRDGNLEVAYERLVAAEVGNSESGWITGTLGQVMIALGSYEEGIQRLRRAYQLSPDLDWVAVELADAMRTSGNTREALSWALKATAVGGENAWAWAVLGATHLQMEGWEEARSALDRALSLAPSYAWALGLKANLLTSINELDDALETAERALEADPEAAWVLTIMVWLLTYRDADPETVERLARKGLQIDARDQALTIGMAESLLRRGQVGDAETWFQKGAAFASLGEGWADGPTMANVAWCRLRLRDYEGALDALSKALSLGAPAVPARFDTALSLLCMGRHAAAVDEYENTVALVRGERHPGRRGFYLHVARTDLTFVVATGQLKDDDTVALVRKALSEKTQMRSRR